MNPQHAIIAGPSRAPAQSSVISENGAGADTASSPVTEDEDPGLTPRAWPIVEIRNRRDSVLRGVDEYEVLWPQKKYATTEVLARTRRGQQTVKVGNRWQVVRQVKIGAGRRDGEVEQVVEWAPTWHTIWELPSAFAAIVDYENRHPRVGKQLTMRTKPDLRNWPLVLLQWYEPEEEPEIDHGDDRIGGENFVIVAGVDYTMSLLRYFKRLLREFGKLPSPAIAALLCMPVRQRLVFNPGHVDSNSTLGGGTKMWRVLPVYVVGLARRQPCGNCAAGGDGLPFPKCVSWGGIFADACVNCVVSGSAYSTTCDCRIGPWSWKDNVPGNEEPDESQTDAESAQSPSSEDGRDHSTSARSSVGPDHDDVYTPPSEQGSPSRGGEQASKADQLVQRDATGNELPAPRKGSSRHSAPPDSPCKKTTAHAEHRDASLQPSKEEQSPSHDDGNLGDQTLDLNSNIAGLNVSSADTTAGGYGPGLDRRSTPVRAFQPANGRFGPWSPHSSAAGNSNASDQDASFGNDGGSDDTLSASGHSSFNSDIRDNSAEESPTADRNSSSQRLGKRPVFSRNGINVHQPESKRPCVERAATSARTFKCEPTSSSTDGMAALKLADIDVSHHNACSRHPQDPCIDPEIGAPPSRPFTRFDPPPGAVYAHDHSWEAGTLEDDNVEFIMSFCPCKVTQWLDDAWNLLLEANPANEDLSRYAVLSRVYTDELNKFIQTYCPGQPQRPGEVIEID